MIFITLFRIYYEYTILEYILKINTYLYDKKNSSNQHDSVFH